MWLCVFSQYLSALVSYQHGGVLSEGRFSLWQVGAEGWIAAASHQQGGVCEMQKGMHTNMILGSSSHHYKYLCVLSNILLKLLSISQTTKWGLSLVGTWWQSLTYNRGIVLSEGFQIFTIQSWSSSSTCQLTALCTLMTLRRPRYLRWHHSVNNPLGVICLIDRPCERWWNLFQLFDYIRG